MSEINSAFDQIMDERRGKGHHTENPYGQYRSSASSSFADIRAMIQGGRLTEAEELLDGTPLSARNAEWYFLKGSIYYSRGWLEDAANHFATACRMEPNNAEYRAAYNRMGWQRPGKYPADTARAHTASLRIPPADAAPATSVRGLSVPIAAANAWAAI